jgi:hypothetical protein
MPAHVAVELDIFSGMPNPRWSLVPADADHLWEQLAALPPALPVELSGHLGYRGFILQVEQGAETEVIHVQAGAVRITRSATSSYFRDVNRKLERWLLDTGRPRLNSEVLQVVERDLR